MAPTNPLSPRITFVSKREPKPVGSTATLGEAAAY
jgi:hypothetical protein